MLSKYLRSRSIYIESGEKLRENFRNLDLSVMSHLALQFYYATMKRREKIEGKL